MKKSKKLQILVAAIFVVATSAFAAVLDRPTIRINSYNVDVLEREVEAECQVIDDGGSPIKGYRGETLDVKDGVWRIYDVKNANPFNRNSCNFKFQDMLEDHTYRFRLFSITLVGESDPAYIENPIAF